MEGDNEKCCRLTEDNFSNHLTVLNKSYLQPYKLSLQSSSNSTSNFILKEACRKNRELHNGKAIENLLDCTNVLLKNVDTSNAKTWTSALSEINTDAIFENSLALCSKCSSKPQTNIFTKMFSNQCKCNIPHDDANGPVLTRTISSEGSSQEFVERYKPQFGNIRHVKNQLTNQHVDMANRINSKSKDRSGAPICHIDLTEKNTSDSEDNFDEKLLKNKHYKKQFKAQSRMNLNEDMNVRSKVYNSYKCEEDYIEEKVYRRSYVNEDMGPAKPMTKEEEEKMHKSNVAKITFRTAKETLMASNPAMRRTLGASRKAQAKFVSPMIGALEAQEKQGSEPEITDERLKHIDPKMIELIESEIIDKGTPIDWEDIAGLQLAKSVIQEAVVWPLLRPDIFTGLRRPPKGILLFGPPGTGKTLIGKCIASQCHATFFSISASSLTSKWIGDGEKMVRALFAVATCHQPAVIFIDEIDSLLTQRSDTEHEATRRIKTEFLVQFDGAATGDEDRILIVGATNRPQELDEAARRRLVKRLYIPLPDVDARKQIISNLLKTENNDLNPSEIMEIANLTDGYSGADMKSLCSEAAMGPIRSVPLSQIFTIDRNKVRPVCVQDFINALQRVKPSVSQDDLSQYVKWNSTYGQGF